MTRDEIERDLRSYYLRQLQKGNITQESYDKTLTWIESGEDWLYFPMHKTQDSNPNLSEI